MPPAPAGTRPAPPLDVRKLKRRIESVAGRAAREVEVVRRADNGLEIRFKVATVEEGEKVSAKLVGLSELEPYQISFQMQLDH